ncbi:MAG: glycosyltransferase [Thermodesulfobacteriota bacterium]
MSPEIGYDNNPSSSGGPLTGVILAAGRGGRAYPSSHCIPKALMEVAGRPIIDRTIDIMTRQLGVSRIIVVIGHCGDQIVSHLSRRDFGVAFVFVEQKQINGTGHALLMTEPYVGVAPFVVMLGDEFYSETNHDILLESDMSACAGVLMFKEEKDRHKITANYTGEIRDRRVYALLEKPVNPGTGLMGVGTYLLTAKVFDYIRRTHPSDLRNEIELTDALSEMARREIVMAAMLSGIYVNVNNMDDLNRANCLARTREFSQKKVTVLIPACNEEETIGGVIDEFGAYERANEILVVDNNSNDRTREIAVKAGARVVTETRQGYGYALRRGLEEATGDIIIVTEADGSFTAGDIPKFMEYLKDCDMVIGTRTTRQMIEQGANMGTMVRWGNVLYGKIIEILWWGQEPRFTDVGCTYRALWKTSYEKIRPYLNASGPEFSPEMMIAMLICRKRIIEIPVTYRKRLGGTSKHSGHFIPLARTALKMMGMILKLKYRYCR